MKKLLFLFTAALAFSFSSNSQTSLTQAVDFDITFTDGEEFNLLQTLESGKHVVIDFFFTTCGPCQANQAYYTQAYENFGCNSGDVIFISVENTVDDAATIAYEETYAGENAPPAASGIEGGGIEVADAYNIGAFPTFILIAPDGSILEQDIWPLNGTADTFTDYLGGHGLETSPNLCVVSVDEVSADASISVYPNPTSDFTNLNLSGFSGEVTVQVFDLLGKEVISLQTFDPIEILDFTHLSEGNYVVRAFDAASEVTKRISVIK